MSKIFIKYCAGMSGATARYAALLQAWCRRSVNSAALPAAAVAPCHCLDSSFRHDMFNDMFV
jgi:hypothetical protein